MVIIYHGGEMVKIQQGDLAVALRPDGSDEIRIGGKNPFVINGPGEYEVSNVFIQGFGAPGRANEINTIYLLSLDGLRLVHWGTLDEDKIPEAAAGIGEADILFVPLDGATLSPAAVYRLALTFQPKLIIPLAESEAILGKFLKEAGAEDVKPIDKLALKKKDVLEKEGEVVVLSAV